MREASGPTEEYLEVSGGRVHLLRAGEGEPLLFLHAAGGAGQWNEFLQAARARRFEVFAPDHPGFGGSDDLPEIEAMDDLVYHYLDLIDALGLERPARGRRRRSAAGSRAELAVARAAPRSAHWCCWARPGCGCRSIRWPTCS